LICGFHLIQIDRLDIVIHCDIGVIL